MYYGRLIGLYYNHEERDNNESLEIIDEGTVLQEENQYKTIYYEEHQDGFSNSLKYIIETPNEQIYTNIPTLTINNLEEMKDKMAEEEIHWIKTQQGISSSLQWQEEDFYIYRNIKNSGNQIYTYFSKDYDRNGSYYIQELVYKIAKTTYEGIWFYLPTGIIGLALVIVYLFHSVGHKEGQEEICLNSFDKLPLEIVAILMGGLYAISFGMGFATMEIVDHNSRQFALIFVGAIPFYLVTILTFVTALRRIKSHTFFTNSICYRVLNKAIHVIRNIKLSLRTAIAYFWFGLLTTILILGHNNGWNIILLIALWLACGIYLLNRIAEYYKIRGFIQSLYEGNEAEPLKEEEFKGEFKKIVPKLNDIASGFSNAIEKGIQSERLKTELITNVSHDIKTPLTSIINYVDLMKKEDIDNEKVKEYLEVLDKKSQRLKKLTEDLVEASKASSGNIKLHRESLDMKELISQELGEFDERFKAKELQIIETFSEEDMVLNADGKYMSRVLDNIFSNIAKYALPNSRVYIDAKTKEGKMEISFKNISANQLNITAEELMERFVRGDVARTTEGSGLGLSIARSLTELQGGSFDIYLDGDLFKVVLKF